MNKVKVNKEVGEALDELFLVRRVSRSVVLELHFEPSSWDCADFVALQDVSPIEMANILVNGYEVELTPEDRVLRRIEALQVLVDGNNSPDVCKAAVSRQAGLIEAYELLTGKAIG